LADQVRAAGSRDLGFRNAQQLGAILIGGH